MVTDADSVLKSGFMIIWESCPDEMSQMTEINAKYTVHLHTLASCSKLNNLLAKRFLV